MKNSLKFIAVALLAIFFTGCSVKEPEPYDYSAFLQKKTTLYPSANANKR